jgi:hypothetical protein
MDKKNKGLVDNHDGDIILNESGTSVSFGWDAGEDNTDNENDSLKDDKEYGKDEPSDDVNGEAGS